MKRSTSVKPSILPEEGGESSGQEVDCEHAAGRLATSGCQLSAGGDRRVLGWSSASLLVSTTSAASATSGRRFVLQHLRYTLIIGEQFHNMTTSTNTAGNTQWQTIWHSILLTTHRNGAFTHMLCCTVHCCHKLVLRCAAYGCALLSVAIFWCLFCSCKIFEYS